MHMQRILQEKEDLWGDYKVQQNIYHVMKGCVYLYIIRLSLGPWSKRILVNGSNETFICIIIIHQCQL